MGLNYNLPGVLYCCQMYSLIATIKFIKKKKIINEPKHKIDPDLSPFFTNPDSVQLR